MIPLVAGVNQQGAAAAAADAEYSNTTSVM